MHKQSKWLTLLSVLVLMGIVASGCAKATVAPTEQQPTTVATEAVTAEPVTTEALPTQPPPTTAPAKSSITVVIAEDPPSFNPAVGQTGFDSLVMELVMLALADVDEQGNAYPQIATELPSV